MRRCSRLRMVSSSWRRSLRSTARSLPTASEQTAFSARSSSPVMGFVLSHESLTRLVNRSNRGEWQQKFAHDSLLLHFTAERSYERERNQPHSDRRYRQRRRGARTRNVGGHAAVPPALRWRPPPAPTPIMTADRLRHCADFVQRRHSAISQYSASVRRFHLRAWPHGGRHSVSGDGVH